MKKLLLITFALVIMLPLAACGGNTNTMSDNNIGNASDPSSGSADIPLGNSSNDTTVPSSDKVAEINPPSFEGDAAILIGLTSEEVVALLGRPEGTMSSIAMYHGLSLQFLNDKVIDVKVGLTEKTDIAICGIRIGDTMEEAEKKLEGVAERLGQASNGLYDSDDTRRYVVTQNNIECTLDIQEGTEIVGNTPEKMENRKTGKVGSMHLFGMEGGTVQKSEEYSMPENKFAPPDFDPNDPLAGMGD